MLVGVESQKQDNVNLRGDSLSPQIWPKSRIQWPGDPLVVGLLCDTGVSVSPGCVFSEAGLVT